MTENSTAGKKKRRIGLRTGVFLWFFGFALFIIAALWISQYFFLDEFYSTTMKRRMAHMADEVFRLYTEKGDVPAKGDLSEIAEKNNASVRLYCVYESGGEVFPVEISSATLPGGLTQGAVTVQYRLFLRKIYADIADTGEGRFYSFRLSEDADAASLSTRLLYADLHTTEDGENILLLLDCPFRPADATVSILRYQLFIVSLLIFVTAVILSYFFSRRMTRPLIRMNRAAAELPQGIYNEKSDSGYREIAELSATLSASAEELQRTDRYEKELIANVSHDLRTPLTMIIGYGEVMRDIESERTPDNMQVVIDEAQRLSEIVSDLLELSRYQSCNTKDSRREIFDISAAVGETLERYRRMKAAAGFTFAYETDGAAPVYADHVEIMRVFCNLVNNAVNYSGDSREIEVTCRKTESSVTVSVRDHGIGIAKEELPHIFERYYKVDKTHSRARVGSGIGLAIVRKILSDYGAAYGADSTPGDGSVFWFRLPLVMMGEALPNSAGDDKIS